MLITSIFKIIHKLKIHYIVSKGVKIGRDTYISPTAYIDLGKPNLIEIGSNCYITRDVMILSHTDTKKGGPLCIWKDIGGTREYGSVKIGNNVFIGVKSVIMPGVTIADDVIIGAMTLVNRDVPKGKIVFGIPGRIVGKTIEHIRGKNNKYIDISSSL